MSGAGPVQLKYPFYSLDNVYRRYEKKLKIKIKVFLF